MSNDSLRVGIIGAGANTRSRHIPGLQAIDGVEVVSICNRSRASSERVAQEFGIPQVYESWQELIHAEDTDAIVIGTWPYMHCRLTIAALEAGSVAAQPQSEAGVTYAAKIDKAEAQVDWRRTAIELDRQIRGLSPFPGAWLFDTRLAGNSTAGHDYGTDLSKEERAALVEYLKTL